MRDSDHDETEAFHCTTANGEAMYAHARGAPVLSERLVREAMTSRLSVRGAARRICMQSS